MRSKTDFSPGVYKKLLSFQKTEINDSLIYASIAKRQKDKNNKTVLMTLAKSERRHYEVWKSYTGREVGPNLLWLYWYIFLCRVLGATFTIKFLEKSEYAGVKNYRPLAKEILEIPGIIAEEGEHEDCLIAMIDEERLHYAGAMVLGLNDALVELTGTIAGLTFALASTRLTALSGIITGISATLSMAASNYLAERADGNRKALKSSVYTGMAYLITVALMVLPYLLLPDTMYVTAFVVMLIIVALIIFMFNFYLAVAQSLSFWRRFGEMAIISLSVAAISFAIGLLAKSLLGIDV
ncbi:MAG: VIT1/CCC1 transporter family protein [Treponema sp.]|jgi:VIT1/CCC1 family predicted Fe2+/Mn2+ transporter|nr:VIT1/CCC1 transporter family protein [Treponema sp.]